MSDTFYHEEEAFERWENGECDIPSVSIKETPTKVKKNRPPFRTISGYIEEIQIQCQGCKNWQRVDGFYCMNCGELI